MLIVMTLTSNAAGYKDRALETLGQLPPFSPVLNKLLASLAKDDVSFSDLGDWIEKDTVLAGNVLRLVNSAAYGRRATVSSVRHAIAILGLVKLRNTALGLSVCRMWTQVRTPKGWSTARFNLHGAACAVMADLLAQHRPTIYPEGAFIAGLMHDLGRLLIALGLPDQHNAIQQIQAATGRTMVECEEEVLGFRHAQLSEAALLKWNLPQPICDAVARHHAANLPADSLAFAVQLADTFVNRHGIAIAAPPSNAEPVTPEQAIQVLADFGLGDSAERAFADFEKEFSSLQSCF